MLLEEHEQQWSLFTCVAAELPVLVINYQRLPCCLGSSVFSVPWPLSSFHIGGWGSTDLQESRELILLVASGCGSFFPSPAAMVKPGSLAPLARSLGLQRLIAAHHLVHPSVYLHVVRYGHIAMRSLALQGWRSRWNANFAVDICCSCNKQSVLNRISSRVGCFGAADHFPFSTHFICSLPRHIKHLVRACHCNLRVWGLGWQKTPLKSQWAMTGAQSRHL